MSGEISKARANSLLEFGVPGGTGEPPARVPHGKTVRRTVLSPLLRFMSKKNFALCAGRKGLHYFSVGAGKFIFAHMTYTHLLCQEAPDSRKGCPYGLHKADSGRNK